MKKFGNILWGLVFIIVGCVFALNALEITDINIFFDGWWTLIIIIPCFIGLFKEEHKTGNIIGLMIGVVLLLSCLDVISFDVVWKLMFPAILVIIGLSFIFRDTMHSKFNREFHKAMAKEGELGEYCATFGGQDINFQNEEFKGAQLTAVFGAVKCDLRKAIIKKDQVLDCSAIFGGIDILLPQDVNIKVKSTPIFGGVTNKSLNDYDEKRPTIYINSVAIFGGVDIK